VVPAGVQEPGSLELEADILLFLVLTEKDPHENPPPQEVLFAQVQTGEPEAIVDPHAQIDPGGPLVLGVDIHVPGPVGLGNGEDVRLPDETVGPEESPRLFQ
jgi:hypothetical protein